MRTIERAVGRWLGRHRPNRFLAWYDATYPPQKVIGTKADGSVRTFGSLPAAIRSATFTQALVDYRQEAWRPWRSSRWPRWMITLVVIWQHGWVMVDANNSAEGLPSRGSSL